MPAGCNCGPNSPLARTLGCHCVRRGILQSLPVSCHFRGCEVPLFRIVSGAISSELALPLPFYHLYNKLGKLMYNNFPTTCPVLLATTFKCSAVSLPVTKWHVYCVIRYNTNVLQPSSAALIPSYYMWIMCTFDIGITSC